MYYEMTGSLEKFREIIALNADQEDSAGYIAATSFDLHMAERNYAEAEKAIADSPVTIIEIFTGPRLTKNYFFGVVAIVQGDRAKARPFFESELQFARNELNEAPDSEARHAQLGLLCAYLGRKEEAIAEGQRAIDLMPVSKDAFDGTAYLVNQAQIYAWVNETDKALDLVEQLLTTPNGLPFQDLKFPVWDPLRNHPRFQKLLSGLPPKIVYQ
jgi:serine/threonine-protein kinase